MKGCRRQRKFHEIDGSRSLNVTDSLQIENTPYRNKTTKDKSIFYISRFFFGNILDEALFCLCVVLGGGG